MRWEICCNCEGEGSHSRHLGVISDISEWDSEDVARYMAGGYDQPCRVCRGTGKVRAEHNRSEQYYSSDQEYYWRREGGY